MKRVRAVPFLLSIILTVLVALCIASLPVIVQAADLSLEKGLQKSLEQSRDLAERIEGRLRDGKDVASELKRLRKITDDVKASHLLIQERFRKRDEKVKTLGSKATRRQADVSEGYRKALERYLAVVEAIPADSRSSDLSQAIQELKTVLGTILRKKQHPILGTLPYKHLNYESREPYAVPAMVPAYQGGNQAVSAEDTASTDLAPVSAEIATLAQSLNWNPVSIYEYVKNSIDTEWYWGCMKGASETLRQRSGNDCDQATLLAALFRASGYPTRYVRGTIEFFPDIEGAKNLTGLDEPQKIAEFFRKAGIPHRAVMNGSEIANFQIEHLWVEALVPYANYRGVVMDDQGKIWLALDTSIKAAGYASNNPGDIIAEFALSGIRDDYLAAAQTQTPLEYLRTRINSYLAQNHPGKTYADYLGTRTLNPEVMHILPSGLQFNEIAITNEYADIPPELIHKIRLTASSSSQPAPEVLFDITLDTLRLSNRKIIVSYEPESVDDHEIINAFGGLDNTPAYLVHLRPVLLLDDEQIIVGSGGVAMGGEYDLAISVISPNGTETFTNTVISGNMTAIGIVSGTAAVPSDIDQQAASNLLSREALRYIDNWNTAESELASLIRIAHARPLPTVATLANQIDVTALLDQPYGFEWKGLYLDADLRAAEAAGKATGTAVPVVERERMFMQLSALQGSVLENRVFEEAFQVESVSTAKLYTIASSSAVPILEITALNIDTVLPGLPFAQNVKDDITASVAQGLVVRIPASEMSHENWTGIGWIKENATTGEAGYMLSGMVAGGMTALGPLQWPEIWRVPLAAPYLSDEVNTDPDSAYIIEKITGTDLQPNLKVGTEASLPLQVRVRDIEQKLVFGASVTFAVETGGGFLIDENDNNTLKSSVTVITDMQGLASARLVLGKCTNINPGSPQCSAAADANPRYILKPNDEYSTMVSEHIIDAYISSGPKQGTGIGQPFTEFAFPDVPSQMTTLPDGTGDILSFYGTASLYVKDQYGNAVANVPVDFSSLSPTPKDPSSLCLTGQAARLTIDKGCKDTRASWNECVNAADTLHGVKSASEGNIHVGVILGDLPNAVYPINAVTSSGSEQLSASFFPASNSFGNCIGSNLPSHTLFAKYFYETGAAGISIEARQAGVPAPVRVKSYWLGEGQTTEMVTFSCDPDPSRTCSQILGDRTYSTSQPADLKVTFATPSGKTTGNAAPNSMYEAMLTLPVGKHSISISAAASRQLDVSNNSCSGCSTTSQKVNRAATTTAQIFGVDITMTRIPIIHVDSAGYSTSERVISYDILPAEYEALDAYVLLYKGQTLIYAMPTEKKGQGMATIAKGFRFDLNSTYDVEVVLNYGNRSEIRSARNRLKISKLFTDVSTPCELLPAPHTCVDSFIVVAGDAWYTNSAATLAQNIIGDEIIVKGRANDGTADISDQITWICNDVPNDGIDSGTCTIISPPGTTGAIFKFKPNPPQTTAGTGRTKPLAYEVKASVSIGGVIQEDSIIIKQDNLDELRQEYVDLRRRNGNSGPGGPPVRIAFDQDPPAFDNLKGPLAEPDRHFWHILRNVNALAIKAENRHFATFGKHVGFVSGFRCPSGNQTLVGNGGAANSNHQYGAAFDFDQPTSKEIYDVYATAISPDVGAAGDTYLAGDDGNYYFKDNRNGLGPPTWPAPAGVNNYSRGHIAW